MIHNFGDEVLKALDFIDSLPKGKKGHLRSRLIEGVYTKRGLLIEGLYEWTVEVL